MNFLKILYLTKKIDLFETFVKKMFLTLARVLFTEEILTSGEIEACK